MYEAQISFEEVKCSVVVEFDKGTPEGTGSTRYVLATYSGDAMFSSTACPNPTSFCSLSRCLKFQEETGACITLQNIVGGLAPAPRQSEILKSARVSGTFASNTYPMAYVSDSNLQPVDVSNLTLAGGFFKYEDFEMTEKGNQSIDKLVHTIETDGKNAFVTLYGSNQMLIPEDCNVCSNAYDLYLSRQMGL